MTQDRTQYNSSRRLHILMVFSLCLIYPVSIFAQQDQAVIDVQNPTVYEYPVPYASQEDSMRYFSQGQQMTEPPPGPYLPLPDFYQDGEFAMDPNQNAFSIPLDNSTQASKPHGVPDAPPVDNAGGAYPQHVPQPLDNSGYTYPQNVPPPQAPIAQQGSHGIYKDIPQYGGQRQGYPAYGGENAGYYQPPAYAYPPGGYQNRVPQAPPGYYQYKTPPGHYQGYSQGQQNLPAENIYMDNRAYPPPGYAYPNTYPQGFGSTMHPNRNYQ